MSDSHGWWSYIRIRKHMAEGSLLFFLFELLAKLTVVIQSTITLRKSFIIVKRVDWAIRLVYILDAGVKLQVNVLMASVIVWSIETF